MNDRDALIAALQWHIDRDAAFAVEDAPVNHLKPRLALDVAAHTLPEGSTAPFANPSSAASSAVSSGASSPAAPRMKTELPPQSSPIPAQMPGSAAAIVEARKLAMNCDTLEALSAAIADFGGLGIRKTATNMVFADGVPQARVMIVGEAPGADEDRIGKPFVGRSGQLLDLMFSFVGLSRSAADDPTNALYISNIVNWRPPGNRNPDPVEMEMSLPFIERHIALVNPSVLVLAGGIAAKALLPNAGGIMKLRGKFTTYRPITPDIAAGTALAARLTQNGTDGGADSGIPVLPMLHPAYLLRTPLDKELAWRDLLSLRSFLAKQTA